MMQKLKIRQGKLYETLSGKASQLCTIQGLHVDAWFKGRKRKAEIASRLFGRRRRRAREGRRGGRCEAIAKLAPRRVQR
jgi:hypothetical protein